MKFEKLNIPIEGSAIRFEDGALRVPDDRIVPFIEGDGLGPAIWAAARPVLDAAVSEAYRGARRLHWFEIYAGGKARDRYGEWLPQDTLEALRAYGVGLKGPLATPIGGGFGNLDVALRRDSDLYVRLRPIRCLEGVASPVRWPAGFDLTVFQENIEGLCAGIEWRGGSEKCRRVVEFLNREMDCGVPSDAAIGVRPASGVAAKRLVRAAIRFALAHGKPSVTLAHRGDVMKFTEGAFKEWGYEVARDEFADRTVNEDPGRAIPEALHRGRVMMKERAAESILGEILACPGAFSIIATTSLNGDALSNALEALVGGPGLAPAANLGDGSALFEAAHGTMPAPAEQSEINPCSMILAGRMMLEHLGWKEAAERIERGVRKTLAARRVTPDLVRQMEGATAIGGPEFAQAVMDGMRADG